MPPRGWDFRRRADAATKLLVGVAGKPDVGAAARRVRPIWRRGQRGGRAAVAAER